MNIRQLRVFNEVCKHMNMTKAAESLHLSQPAISKTIAELESWYGLKLFERWNKNIFLTPSGEVLYDYAKHILQIVEKMDLEVKQRMRMDLIRVGASITIGTSILSDIVEGFLKEHKGIRIEAVVDNTKVIEDLLLQNRLDIGLVEGKPVSEDMEVEVFGASDVVLVCSEKHPLYTKKEITKEDLEGMDFIVREEGSGGRALFEAAMKSLDIHWNPAWVCHNTQAIKNATSTGLGIGVLSKLSVRKRLRSGEFRSLPIFDPPIQQKFLIVHHNQKFMSKNIVAFKKYIVDKFGELEAKGRYE